VQNINYEEKKNLSLFIKLDIAKSFNSVSWASVTAKAGQPLVTDAIHYGNWPSTHHARQTTYDRNIIYFLRNQEGETPYLLALIKIEFTYHANANAIQ
jgi:hypothetical protein